MIQLYVESTQWTFKVYTASQKPHLQNDCFTLLYNCQSHVKSKLYVFALAEYLRGNVLPAEQYAAADLPCLLHPDSHLEALTGGPPQADGDPFFFLINQEQTDGLTCKRFPFH